MGFHLGPGMATQWAPRVPNWPTGLQIWPLWPWSVGLILLLIWKRARSWKTFLSNICKFLEGPGQVSLLLQNCPLVNGSGHQISSASAFEEAWLQRVGAPALDCRSGAAGAPSQIRQGPWSSGYARPLGRRRSGLGTGLSDPPHAPWSWSGGQAGK